MIYEGLPIKKKKKKKKDQNIYDLDPKHAFIHNMSIFISLKNMSIFICEREESDS